MLENTKYTLLFDSFMWTRRREKIPEIFGKRKRCTLKSVTELTPLRNESFRQIHLLRLSNIINWTELYFDWIWRQTAVNRLLWDAFSAVELRHEWFRWKRQWLLSTESSICCERRLWRSDVMWRLFPVDAECYFTWRQRLEKLPRVKVRDFREAGSIHTFNHVALTETTVSWKKGSRQMRFITRA